MAKRIRNIKKLHHEYHYRDRNIRADLEIDLGRFEGQYSRAQYLLDSMVMNDMIPYMPMQTAQFMNVTRAMSASIAGSGKVVAAAPPFGRFLYNGKVMVGEQSGSPWAKKGERKVVTDRNLEYYRGRHPQARSHWFDAAKKKNQKKWIRQTRNTAGGGQ